MIDLETVAVAVGSSLVTSGAAFRLLLAAAKSVFVEKSRLYDENDRPLFVPKSSLYDENDRPLFIHREEFNGMSKRRDEQVAELVHRAEQNAGQIVSHTDRLADLDHKVGVMEERNSLIWDGIAKDLRHTADTNQTTVERLESLTLRFERLDATNDARYQKRPRGT